MELCDGSLVEEDTPMNPVRAVSLISDICEGLGYCHENNIIHRDLKPSNILFKNGTVKISDWGLSKVLGESKSTTSQISFSPGYAAPEQIMGTVKDVRTDIWQVGVIFYELVTGMLPFSGETLVEVLSAIATRDPEPPSDLAKGVLSIEPFIMKCLKKDPSERYQAASELRDDLNAYLQSTYSQMLDVSRPLNDRASSAHYYSQLLLLSLKTGDRKAAYTYAEGLTGYLDADKKSRAAEIARETARIMQDTSVPVPAGLLRSVRQMIRDLS
jgi:serine/threonine protein kinase